MAIEGALLRETVRRRGAHVRWIDGEQNMADILTKAGTDKTVLFDYLKTGKLSLVQNERNKEVKEKKRKQRQNRRKVVKDTAHKERMLDDRIKKLAEEMRQRNAASSEEEAGGGQANKEKEGMWDLPLVQGFWLDRRYLWKLAQITAATWKAASSKVCTVHTLHTHLQHAHSSKHPKHLVSLNMYRSYQFTFVVFVATKGC